MNQSHNQIYNQIKNYFWIKWSNKVMIVAPIKIYRNIKSSII